MKNASKTILTPLSFADGASTTPAPRYGFQEDDDVLYPANVKPQRQERRPVVGLREQGRRPLPSSQPANQRPATAGQQQQPAASSAGAAFDIEAAVEKAMDKALSEQ